jgi:hypothetical protein
MRRSGIVGSITVKPAQSDRLVDQRLGDLLAQGWFGSSLS